jgi:tetratricopeptide (TPR) repeat protein
MKMHLRRHLGFLGYVLIIYSFVPAARADGPQWVEVRSPRFSVVTDGGEKRGREVAMRFEQMRAVFGTLMTKVDVNIPVPLQIVAFRNTKEFRQIAPLWHGKPTELAGLFQGGEDRSFIMLDLSVEDPWKVVFHEYAHQLMNGILSRQLDPWFEEGFAEYFSTIEVDNKEARVGKLSEYAYQVLQQNGMMKIADLFKVRHNSQTYNESGDRRTVFYAESNMLVHYIYDNRLLPKVTVYFNLRDKGVLVEDAIQQAFGMSPAQFDKVLSDYVRGGRSMYSPIPTPANIASSGYTVAPLSASDSSAILADIHLHSPDYQDKAIEEFQAILKTDPNNAASCRGLGYAYLKKHQYDQAGEYFRRAAQLDSKDPRVHYYSAMLMSREGAFSDRSNLPEMKKELETAIALDPNFADPYALMAFAQTYSGDPAQGVETMKKAVSLNPRNEIYLFDLGQMYMSNRQFDQAIALFQELQKSSNQQLVFRAASSLSQAEQMKEMSAGMARQGPALRRESQPSAERVDPPPDREPTDTQDVVTEAPKAPPNSNPTKFMTGILTSVDCSAPPAALLTVVSETKTWKMRVADTGRVLVFGADNFSCSWSKKKVSLNYRQSGDAEGVVVSLEIR